ncbi:phospholipase D family protein [Microbacterium sp. RU33B]|uniref:phospholipase D family protein n=1 Tax=Microbacterium sp. RU33B TaxID=1907390 RepID=UPI00095E6EC0|nr:phospholipase D family protein [Microbacterium sp. RU33B]SIT84033.1 PLD-like domain-containing protein [Microbacterium sp. RU33B]
MLQFQLPGAPGGNLLEHLLLESIGAVRGGGIFAWANASGARTFLDDVVIEELLQRSEFRLIVGTDTITDSRAIAKLSEIETRRPRLQVRAFLSPVSSLFHPKLAWFEHSDHLSLIVGSGNLTMGGLLSNWEAMVVNKLTGAEATEALDAIQSFVTHHAASLLPLSDSRIINRVAANDGNERSLRPDPRVPIPSPPAPAAAVGEDEVLVAEIPAAGTRWKQANFDRANYEGFFGARVGSQRRIVLQSVSSDGHLGDIESRQSVEVASQNYRFELSAAGGLPYPTDGPPIGVFVRLATGQFLYTLVLPGQPGYGEAASFLSQKWSGPAREKRRVRSTVSEFREAWNNSPLWTTQLPDL